MQTVAFSSFVAHPARVARAQAPRPARRTARLVVRAEENRVVREYREGDDKITNLPTGGEQAAPANPTSEYADELPMPTRTEMSAEQKAKLRAEYYGFGGSPTKAMNSNYFLNIILIIAFLAVLSYALGYI